MASTVRLEPVNRARKWTLNVAGRARSAGQALRARLKTTVSSLPRIPFSSALRTLCSTNGQRLQRGLLRQHFFLGLMSASLRGFK